MAQLVSVNIGRSRPSEHASIGVTGIDKRPVDGPVTVHDPSLDERPGSGVEGDFVADLRHHGGSEQAVYAYAREDLDEWERDLDRTLSPGVFGENLTTIGLDVGGLLLGEQIAVGDELVLEVTSPRIPCRTFAGWLAENGWIDRFTERKTPGAYFRVLHAGTAKAGDPIVSRFRPDHEISIVFAFRAHTKERELAPRLLEAEPYLVAELRGLAERAIAREG